MLKRLLLKWLMPEVHQYIRDTLNSKEYIEALKASLAHDTEVRALNENEMYLRDMGKGML